MRGMFFKFQGFWLALALFACAEVALGADPAVAPAPAAPPARTEQLLPPRHWAYGHLAKLAASGELPGQPAFFFKGGKTFKRGEIAVLLSDLVQSIKKSRRVPPPDALRLLRELVAEFNPEITALKGDGDLGFLAVRKVEDSSERARLGRLDGFTAHGTYALGLNRQLEKKSSSWTQNMVVNAGRQGTRLNLSVTAEPLEPGSSPGLREFAAGGEAIAKLDKYSLEVLRETKSQLQLSSLFGFAGGGSYNEGLTVGNLNIEGASVSGKQPESHEFDLGFGRTQSEPSDLVGSAHYAHFLSKDAKLHAQVLGSRFDDVNAATFGHASLGAFGLGFEGVFHDISILGESSLLSNGGSGLFLSASWVFTGNRALTLHGRRFDGLNNPYDSPPLYSGISGGDDVDDRGAGFELTLQPVKDITWTMRGDSAYNPAAGQLFYMANEAEAKKELGDLSLGYEREIAAQQQNYIFHTRVGRAWLRKLLKTSMDWSRDRVDGAGSTTTRLTAAHDLLPAVLSLSASLTYKDTASLNSLSQQYGVNWNIRAAQFLSLQAGFNSPDAKNNKVDLNYLLKF